MIKKRIIKRLLVSTAAVFALFLIYLIPKDNYSLKPISQLEYVDEFVKKQNIYLLNDSNLLARTSIVVNNDNTVDLAYEILNVLISGGVGESVIPSGFKAVIPSDTEVIGIDYDNGIIRVNFTNELLNLNKEQELKVIESIVYSLTELDDVMNVSISVEGEELTKLPNSKIMIPTLLNRNFGINKDYNFTSLNDINQVTIYYVDKYNDNYYYVPVTKYVNDDRDKIRIIIDDLTSSNVYNSNLMSFINSNTELLSVKEDNNIMELTFNNYILNDFDEREILEEVIYTICLSVKDNYDVDEVVFNVDNEEIYKKVLKTIE